MADKEDWEPTMSAEEKVDAWMPLWIGAYLADTMTLTTQQHGAYLLLLFAYWRNRGPLLDDDEELASIVKASPDEWPRLRNRLSRFFTVANGVWTHGRCDKELAQAGERRAKAIAKAQAAANKRWHAPQQESQEQTVEQCSEHAPSIAQALHEQCPTPSPSPSPSESSVPNGTEHTARQRKRGRRQAEYSAAFLEAWGAYPARPGSNKADAWKAWRARLNEGHQEQAILDGVGRYAAHVAHHKTEPRYIKQAQTFFGPSMHFNDPWPLPAAPAVSAPRTTYADHMASRVSALAPRLAAQPARHQPDFIDMEVPRAIRQA